MPEIDNSSANNPKPPTFIVGDVHGQLKKLHSLLHDAHVIDAHHSWSAGTATLWFLGDFVDRGPDGIAVLNFVMRLQEEASAAGGQVLSLLGNHEVLLLAAYRFGRRSTGLGSNFLARWKQNGGNPKDISALTSRHLDWMMQLPLMARVGRSLLIHADAAFYLKHGRSVAEVNAALKQIFRFSDALVWEELIEDFARRGAFSHALAGKDFLLRFLGVFGGEQLIHGHTPISTMLACSPQKVTAPLVYADGLCVNLDGGLYHGGRGFVYQLPAALAE